MRTANEPYAFNNCDALESVEIIGTETIGNSAFNSCKNLRSVYLKDVGTIGTSAFRNCQSLQTVYLENLKTIGDYAFGYSSNADYSGNNKSFDVVKNARRRYSLGKIKNLKIKNEVFTLPKDYDFRNMTRGSFGCMCDDDFLDYKIHLHGYAARYAQTKLWGDNQTITPDKKNPGPDGDGIILSFRTNQLICVQRWVWKWADEALPIAPKELVDDEDKKGACPYGRVEQDKPPLGKRNSNACLQRDCRRMGNEKGAS